MNIVKTTEELEKLRTDLSEFVLDAVDFIWYHRELGCKSAQKLFDRWCTRSSDAKNNGGNDND